MPEKEIILAIFDFDGTLSEGHLWSGIAKHHKEQRKKRLSLYFYLLSHLPFWLASKLGFYSEEKNRVKWGEDLPYLLKGYSLKEAHQLFLWLIDNYFMPLMRQDIVNIMKERKIQGYRLMILSGMFSDFLDLIGLKLGVDFVVGTKLEIVDGVYTGRIVGPLCFGENKARSLIEFIKVHNLNVDLPRSVAYADSIFDKSIFLLVGEPVATYPDKELRELAVHNNWKMVEKGNSLGT